MFPTLLVCCTKGGGDWDGGLLELGEGFWLSIAIAEVSLPLRSAVDYFICSGVTAFHEKGSLAVFFVCHDGSTQWNIDGKFICGDPGRINILLLYVIYTFLFSTSALV